jgi:hypothetical protein
MLCGDIIDPWDGDAGVLQCHNELGCYAPHTVLRMVAAKKLTCNGVAQPHPAMSSGFQTRTSSQQACTTLN